MFPQQAIAPRPRFSAPVPQHRFASGRHRGHALGRLRARNHMRSGQMGTMAHPGGYDWNCAPFVNRANPYVNVEGCYPYGDNQICRDYYVGFDSTEVIPAPGLVPVGTQVTLSANPQKGFVGKRLIVPSTIGPSFTIDNLIVANVPQNVAAGPVSAVTFSEVGVGVALSLDPAGPGTLVQLIVTNVGPAPVRFQATLIGNSSAY